MAERVNFVAFRLQQDSTYTDRYDALMDAISLHAAQKWWTPLTSMVVFPSSRHPSELATALEPVINKRTDLVVVGSLTHKSLVVIGNNPDDDIYTFVDFARPG